MKANTRLSAEDRRAAIVKAVRRVFAEKGFDGTTTRALAEAAGVSEALLFRHFPNKEALFVAMQAACCTEQDIVRFDRLHALEPSASTLVLLVHYLVAHVLAKHDDDEERVVLNRLIIRSLAENGEFAGLLFGRLATGWIPKVQECVEAASAAGDAVTGPVLPQLGAWFTHHVAALLTFLLLPACPAVNYGVPRERLVEQVVWFALRGLGLKEETIRRHYNPQALALFGG
jgi:AcrR family transcriptional regulator